MRLELHPTYRCDLACTNCNRACAIRTDHTPDITVEQWRRCLASTPRKATHISIVGGEPTLHRDILPLAHTALRYCPSVRIFSNQNSPHARYIIEQLRGIGVAVAQGSAKALGPINHPNPQLFVAPIDYDLPDRTEPCQWAAADDDCGYSVDACGITSCAIGGAIDGVLGLGVRTWDWAQVDDGRVRDLCRRCGFQYDFPVALEGLGEFRGQTMSRTWLEAARKKGRGV